MTSQQGAELRADNHYIAQFYLRRWAGPDQKVWVYRTLVSHEAVPEWRPHSPRGVGQLHHLYCQVALGSESDEIERWLADYVDGPGDLVLMKIAREGKLSPEDWRVLLRLFAATQVRTLAFYLRRRAAWDKELPPLIDSVLRSTVDTFERGERPSPLQPNREMEVRAELPTRVRVRPNPSGKGGIIEAELLAGRKLWHREIEHMVVHGSRELDSFHWTILRPPAGRSWMTSDDPAVVACVSPVNKVSFGGAWKVPGTVLLLPLDPHHVLLGEMGGGLPVKYSTASDKTTSFVDNCTARTAFRMVFNSARNDLAQSLRPRQVDADRFRNERREISRWRESQSEAERELEDDSTWHVPVQTSSERSS